MCNDKAVNEVESELAKPENKNVFASVNIATGAVATFLATHDATRSSAEVQKDIEAVAAELPKLKGGARSKADHQLRLLERELRLARDLEETDRRQAERSRERQRQQIGADSPFARQTLGEAVASAVAAVQAGVGKTKPVQNKLTWESLRADLDARVPATVTNQSAVCCQGRYLCEKCRASRPHAGA